MNNVHQLYTGDPIYVFLLYHTAIYQFRRLAPVNHRAPEANNLRPFHCHPSSPFTTPLLQAMSSTSLTTTATILSCIGVIIGLILITLVITRDRGFFTFVRWHPALPYFKGEKQHQEQDAQEDDFEQYGNLYVPPDRQPTYVAFDIMNRVAMAVALPTK